MAQAPFTTADALTFQTEIAIATETKPMPSEFAGVHVLLTMTMMASATTSTLA